MEHVYNMNYFWAIVALVSVFTIGFMIGEGVERYNEAERFTDYLQKKDTYGDEKDAEY